MWPPATVSDLYGMQYWKNNNPCWWYLAFEVFWQIEKRVILLLATLQWQLGEGIVNTEDNFPYGKNA